LRRSSAPELNTQERTSVTLRFRLSNCQLCCTSDHSLLRLPASLNCVLLNITSTVLSAVLCVEHRGLGWWGDINVNKKYNVKNKEKARHINK